MEAATFVAAFRRFNSRRGPCQTMMSDNGRTFVGTDRQLREMLRQASAFYKESAAMLTKDGVDWTFIPPYTPYAGGLWEAAVKSVKRHLIRSIGDTKLTFEEMTTLLYQIEACLNSRPISRLSADSSDLVALTPGHFLSGRVPTLIPEPGFPPDSRTPLERWRLIQFLMSSFWRRWSREYLHQLQTRPSWPRVRDNLKVGTLVTVKFDDQPPGTWPLARVLQVFPDSEGRVRTVLLKTASGQVKRSVHHICPLLDD